MPKLKFNSTGVNRLVPNQPLLNYHSCSSSAGIRERIILSENISLSQERFVKKKYFLYNVSLPGIFRLLQLWIKENRNLHTILIADKLSVSTEGNKIKLNSSVKCMANLPIRIFMLTWTCMINKRAVVMQRNKNYPLIEYTEDERSILDNIGLNHDTLHFGLNLPMYVYKCYCEASYRVSATKYVDRKDISFTNRGNVTSIREVIIHKTGDLIRGLMVNIESFRISLFQLYNVTLGNGKWEIIPRDHIDDKNIFIKIDETFIGHKLNLTISVCTGVDCMTLGPYETVYCGKTFKTNIYPQSFEHLQPYEPVTEYLSCKKNENRYVFNRKVRSVYRSINGSYFSYKVNISIRFGFFQFFVSASKKLYSVLISNNLSVSTEKNEIKLNSSVKCTANLPIRIFMLTWTCMINNHPVVLRRYKDYPQINYTNDEISILHNIRLNHDTLHFGLNLPMYVYKCYCEASFRVSATNYTAKQDILFTNRGNINFTKELIKSDKNNRSRGLMVYLDKVKSSLFELWNVTLGNGKWEIIPRDHIDDKNIFIKIDETFIGYKLNLTISVCTGADCMMLGPYATVYCGNKFKTRIFAQSFEHLEPYKPVAHYFSCKKNDNRLVFNPTVHNISRYTDEHYFIHNISISIRFGFCQFWVRPSQKLYSMLIASKLEVYLPHQVNSSDSNFECNTNFPSHIVKFTWSYWIRNQWIQLYSDDDGRKKYTKDEKYILKDILIKNRTIIYFSSNLPINIYICKCRAELRVVDKVIFGEKEIIADFHDPIINQTEEQIIPKGNEHVRGIAVYLSNVSKSLISYWEVSLLRGEWFNLPQTNFNNTHLFIPIEESFIHKTIHLRLKSCTYSRNKCITWRSKFVKYCEKENVVFSSDVIKPLSIWNPLQEFVMFYSCSKKLPVKELFIFNSAVSYEVTRHEECCDKQYYMYNFYIRSGNDGFFQLVILDRKVIYSFIIYEEIKLSLKPDYYDLNMSTRCISNLPDGMLRFKWWCIFKNEIIPIKKMGHYHQYSVIFENLYITHPHTIFFGHALPLNYYSCSCQVSFYLNNEEIKKHQQFTFDFKNLYLNLFLSKLVIFICPYWIAIMILWYVFAWVVFSMLTYILNELLYYKELMDRFEMFYPRRRRRMQRNNGYRDFFIHNNCTMLKEIIAALERLKQSENIEPMPPIKFIIAKIHSDLNLDLPKDNLDKETRNSIMQRLKDNRKLMTKNKKRPSFFSQSSSLHVKENKTEKAQTNKINLARHSRTRKGRTHEDNKTEPVKNTANVPKEPFKTKHQSQKPSTKMKFIKEYFDQPKKEKNGTNNEVKRFETTKKKNMSWNKTHLGDMIGYHMKEYDENKRTLLVDQSHIQNSRNSVHFTTEPEKENANIPTKPRNIKYESQKSSSKMKLVERYLSQIKAVPDKKSAKNEEERVDRTKTKIQPFAVKSVPAKSTEVKMHESFHEQKFQGLNTIMSVSSNKSIRNSKTFSYKMNKEHLGDLIGFHMKEYDGSRGRLSLRSFPATTTEVEMHGKSDKRKLKGSNSEPSTHSNKSILNSATSTFIISKNSPKKSQNQKIRKMNDEIKSKSSSKTRDTNSEKTLDLEYKSISKESKKTITTTVDESWITLMFKPADISDSIISMEDSKNSKNTIDE